MQYSIIPGCFQLFRRFIHQQPVKSQLIERQLRIPRIIFNKQDLKWLNICHTALQWFYLCGRVK